MVIYPLVVLPAIANRYRGESRYHWGPVWAGDTVRRILVAVSVGLICLPDWRAALAMLLLWPGLLLPWARWQDMGVSGSMLGDFAGMTARGLALTGFAGALLWYLGHGVGFGLSGLAMGAIYLGCVLIVGRQPHGPFKGLRAYTEWAELLVGLWLGISALLFVG